MILFREFSSTVEDVTVKHFSKALMALALPWQVDTEGQSILCERNVLLGSSSHLRRHQLSFLLCIGNQGQEVCCLRERERLMSTGSCC